MKYIVAALILSQAVAFTFVSQPRMPTVLSAEPYVLTEGEGKINLKVSQAIKYSYIPPLDRRRIGTQIFWLKHAGNVIDSSRTDG